MNFIQTHAAWKAATPFPHCIIDGFLPVDLCEEARQTVREIPFHEWHQYDSPFEQRKSVCTSPRFVASMRDYCCGPEIVGFVERLSGISGLIPDHSLHGGGFHRTIAGGYLDLHLDYSHHPKLNLERRVSLIVYLSDFQPFAGGRLELWDMESMQHHLDVTTHPNRAVLFENTDKALHGHPRPLLMDAEPRYSFACFYHTAPRPEHVPRPRALFMARPGDPIDPEKERIRLERAGLAKP